MPFFWHVKIFQTYISKKHKINKPSLREIFPLLLFHRLSEILIKYSKKRASSFIFKKTVKAGMTLEAALIFPIFLFACLSLISAINIMTLPAAPTKIRSFGIMLYFLSVAAAIHKTTSNTSLLATPHKVCSTYIICIR